MCIRPRQPSRPRRRAGTLTGRGTTMRGDEQSMNPPVSPSASPPSGIYRLLVILLLLVIAASTAAIAFCVVSDRAERKWAQSPEGELQRIIESNRRREA